MSRDIEVWLTSAASRIHKIDDLFGNAGKIVFGVSGLNGPFVAIAVGSELMRVEVGGFLIGSSATSEMLLSLLRGETDVASGSWASVRAAVMAGEIRPLLQIKDDWIDDDPALAGVPLLGGADGLAVKRARALGHDVAEAEAKAKALSDIFTAGRFVAAPPGLSPDLAACLEQHVYQAMTEPGFAAAADAAGRPLDVARASDALVTLRAAERASGAFMPALERSIAQIRGLAVVAMKVVHPGKSGQAGGCETVSAEREITRMNLHKNARLTPQGRHLPVQRITEQGWTVGAAAALRTVQRQAYRWLARYRAGGRRRCRPQLGPSAAPTSAAARVAIERWRRQRLSGPASARQLGMRVSTVGGILRRLGLGRLAALEPRPPVVRYERERPGELLHIDTKKLGRIEAIGHRITGAALRAAHRGRPWEPAARRDRRRGAGWEAVHVCIDDASRLAYSEVLPDERKTSAVPFLERAVAWFAGQGVTVERVMTDNGSAYRSHHWRHVCGALELRHIRTRPYTPRTNGKAGRFIQTSLREWARACPRAGASRTRGRAPLRARTSAPPRSSPGSTMTTPPGRTLPRPTSRPPPVCANQRSSVRATAPFLRPDLTSAKTGPPGRRQERRRRPAPAGAKRPCAGPPDRSRCNRRAPHARSPEQRSWKRQLVTQEQTKDSSIRGEARQASSVPAIPGRR